MVWCIEYWWAKNFAVSKIRTCAERPHLIFSQTPQPLGHNCKTEVFYLYRWRYVCLTAVWAFTFVRCYVKTIFWELLMGWWNESCEPKLSKFSKIWTWAGWTHVISFHTPLHSATTAIQNLYFYRCPSLFFELSLYNFLYLKDLPLFDCFGLSDGLMYWVLMYWVLVSEKNHSQQDSNLRSKTPSDSESDALNFRPWLHDGVLTFICPVHSLLNRCVNLYFLKILPN